MSHHYNICLFITHPNRRQDLFLLLLGVWSSQLIFAVFRLTQLGEQWEKLAGNSSSYAGLFTDVELAARREIEMLRRIWWFCMIFFTLDSSWKLLHVRGDRRCQTPGSRSIRSSIKVLIQEKKGLKWMLDLGISYRTLFYLVPKLACPLALERAASGT